MRSDAPGGCLHFICAYQDSRLDSQFWAECRSSHMELFHLSVSGPVYTNFHTFLEDEKNFAVTALPTVLRNAAS